MNKSSYQLLLDYAFRILGIRAYTEAEMLRKLTQKAAKAGISEAAQAISEVMARLKELKFIDDEKFLNDYFEYRFKSKPKGRFGFLNDMKKRGIAFGVASAQWENKKIDEEACALQLIEKISEKFQSLPPEVRKRKIAAFLAARGFEAHTIWKLLQN